MKEIVIPVEPVIAVSAAIIASLLSAFLADIRANPRQPSLEPWGYAITLIWYLVCLIVVWNLTL